MFKPIESLKRLFFSEIKFERSATDFRDVRRAEKVSSKSAKPDASGKAGKGDRRPGKDKPSRDSGPSERAHREADAVESGYHLRREKTDANSPLDKVLAALKAVLSTHAQTRNILRHLTFVESAMMRTGFSALDEVPIDVLEIAMEQFEALVINISDPSLITLRAKMATAMIARDGSGADQAMDKPTSDQVVSEFLDDDKLEVKEATFSNFMDAEKEWHAVPVKKPKDGELSLVPKEP